MLSVQEARFPVIAEVGGLATAGGCQLVAACDLAVAAESATFATPGVKIGLFCSTPGAALVRAMPVNHAKESGTLQRRYPALQRSRAAPCTLESFGCQAHNRAR